jgi:hypothetical protein
MIAQIRSRGMAPQPVNRQDLPYFDTDRSEFSLQGLMPTPRPERVYQNPASDSPSHGAGKGIDDLLSGVIVGKDVIQEMHVVLGLVDIRHKLLDGPLVVREKPNRVAAEGTKVSQIEDQSGSLFQARRERGSRHLG